MGRKGRARGRGRRSDQETPREKVQEQRPGPREEPKPSNDTSSDGKPLNVNALSKLYSRDAKNILPFLLKNLQNFASFLDNDETAKSLDAIELVLKILIKGYEETPMPEVFDEVFKKLADSKFFMNVNKVCSSIIQKQETDHMGIIHLSLNITERLLYRFPSSVLPNAIALSATVDWMCEEEMDEEMQNLHENLKRDIEYHFRHSKGTRSRFRGRKRTEEGATSSKGTGDDIEEIENEAICSKSKVQCQDDAGEQKDEDMPKAEGIKDQATVEGNCSRKCDFRLPCGHTCPRQYHTDDPNHTDETERCQQPCDRSLCTNKEHKCKKLCGEECGQCDYETEGKLPCGHVLMVKCGRSLDTIICEQPCRSRLPCGHQCRAGCGRACADICPVPDKEIQLACGHTQMLLCGEKLVEAICKMPCNAVLQCEHPCSGTCGNCYRGHLHQSCKTKCERTLVCGHLCQEPCTKNCPPCEEKCANRCMHSLCQQKCGEECIKCKEKCVWVCEHKRCTKLCFELCDRDRCNEPCTQKIACGHDCIGLCGEPCPKLCRICDKDAVQDIFFGDEGEDDTKFVELSDCGHILSVESLDIWMDRTTASENEDTAIQLKRCPKCNKEIRQHLRYGNVVKRSLTDIEKAKLLIHGNVQENLADVQYIRQAVLSTNQFVNQVRKVPANVRQNADTEQEKSTENTKRALVTVTELWQHLHAFISSEKAHRQQRRTVVSMRYKTDFMKVLMDMLENFLTNEDRYESNEPGTYNRFIKELDKVTDYIIFADGKDKSPRITFSAQNLDDIEWFITRLKQLIHYMTLSVEKPKPNRMSEKLYVDCRRLILNTAPYRQETMEAVTRQLVQMEKLRKDANANAKQEDKKLVLLQQDVLVMPTLPKPMPMPRTSKMVSLSKTAVSTLESNTYVGNDQRIVVDFRHIGHVLNTLRPILSQPSVLLGQNDKLRNLWEHIQQFVSGNATNEPPETVVTMKAKADYLNDIVNHIQNFESDLRNKSIQFDQMPDYNVFMKELDQVVTIITYGDEKTQHKSGRIFWTFDEQDMRDIEWMIKRLGQFSQFLFYSTLMKRKGKAHAGLDTCRQVLFNSFPFREAARNQVQGHLDNMAKVCNEPEDGISREELLQITQALGLTMGHWYRCPNGHIYAIGEQGGAVEESICNECGAAIGGRDFELVDGNEYAPEMDRQSMYPVYHDPFAEIAQLKQIRPKQKLGTEGKQAARPVLYPTPANLTDGRLLRQRQAGFPSPLPASRIIGDTRGNAESMNPKAREAFIKFARENQALNEYAVEMDRQSMRPVVNSHHQARLFNTGLPKPVTEQSLATVLENMKNVEHIKMVMKGVKAFFDKLQNTRRTSRTLQNLEYPGFRQLYEHLNKFINQEEPARASSETINKMKAEADFVQQLVQVLERFEADLTKKGIKRNEIQYYDLLDRDLTMIATAITSSNRKSLISNQEKENTKCFIARLQLFCEFTVLATVLKKKGRTYPNLDKCCQTILNINPYKRQAAEKEVKHHMKAMEELGKALPGLGINSTERVQIARAVGLAKGHWFKCPNGHVYAIGECGGAQQSSKCPECGAAIGGQNYRLATGNKLAAEMDGAKFAAWSEQANMGNYDPHELERLARF